MPVPEDTPSNSRRLATLARYAIVAAFAAAVFSGTGKSGRGASAATPVGAAPSTLSFTVRSGKDSRFYLTDGVRKTVCAYSLVNDQVLLVGARKMDEDVKIVDSSVKIPGLNASGAMTREQAANYVKQRQPFWDALAQKYKQPKFGGE